MNVIGKTERYVYLKTGVDPALYDQLVRQFDGNHHRALQHLRIRFNALLAGLARDPAPGPQRIL